jgi:hypothetical protein
LLAKGGVFLKGTEPAAGGAVSGAERLSALGDATAFATVCTDMGAFFDHGRLLRAREKARRGEPFLFFYPISSEYQTERINTPKMIEGIRV